VLFAHRGTERSAATNTIDTRSLTLCHVTLCLTLYLRCRHAYGGGFGFAHPAACEYIHSSSNDSTTLDSSTFDSNASSADNSTSVLEDDPEAVMQVLTAAHAAGMEVRVTVALRNVRTA
jgi:hypothetical protein